ncbi:hypothetical protein LJ69_14400 [Listeria monocytogenes]|nr:hypothetical protein [Listeria monocytogenes]EAD7205279.1 hypothetical protein [Listeria monocytogenes]
MPHKKIRRKKGRERSRDKVKGQGQEIRATTTTPQAPCLHQSLKEGEEEQQQLSPQPPSFTKT